MVPAKYWNSSNNQLVKRDFVHNEVYTCISDMAPFLFNFNPDEESYASYEDFSNYYKYICPHCGETIADPEADICPYCFTPLPDDLESEPAEILEFYLVSPWLGAKLDAYGECIFPRFGAWIWGRQCSGQAILLDHVISQICNDVDLLVEG